MSKTILEETLGEFAKEASSSGEFFGKIKGMASATVALNVALHSVPPPEGVDMKVWKAKTAEIMAAYTEALKAQIASHETVIKAHTKAAASAIEGGTELLAGELP